MPVTVVKPVDSSPELIHNMAVEANEEDKRDSKAMMATPLKYRFLQNVVQYVKSLTHCG